MHSRFNPEDYNVWLQYYAAQAAQTGYGMEGFRGFPYQRGAGLGSFFRSLFRMAVPILKTTGRQIGKHALAAGANILSDVARGRPLFDSAKEHAQTETSRLFKDVSESLQTGEGLGNRLTSINKDVLESFTKVKKKRRNGFNRQQIYSQLQD
jgi:hypothetical protein